MLDQHLGASGENTVKRIFEAIILSFTANRFVSLNILKMIYPKS